MTRYEDAKQSAEPLGQAASEGPIQQSAYSSQTTMVTSEVMPLKSYPQPAGQPEELSSTDLHMIQCVRKGTLGIMLHNRCHTTRVRQLRVHISREGRAGLKSSYTGHSSKCFRSSTFLPVPVLENAANRRARGAFLPEHSLHRRSCLGTLGRCLRPCSTSRCAHPMRSWARFLSRVNGRHNRVWAGAVALEWKSTEGKPTPHADT